MSHMMLKELTQKLPFLQMSGKHTKGKQEPPDIPPAAAIEADDKETVIEPPTEEEPAAEEELAAETDAAVPEEPERPLGEMDFEAGMLACKEKNYQEALAMLLRAAETGHKEAQFVCGQLYQRGLTANADDKRALAWYKRAAKQGFLPAQIACAAMYEEGAGTAMNMKRALYWYEQAAKQGSIPAQLKCGRMYYCGRAENRNPKKARIWLETAADSGSEEAKKLLHEYF